MNVSHGPAPLERHAPPEAAPPTAARPAALRAVAPGWPAAAGAIAAAAVAFGFAFHHDIRVAIATWLYTTAYNHCFLILPLVGFLLWERRAVFAAVSPRPAYWAMAAMPVLSAVWLVAAVLDLNEGRQFAVVAMFEIVLLTSLGPQAFRLLLAPLLFLFFLVPSGEFLIPTLQRITADITVHGLQLLNIPVFSDGLMIEIPEGKFEIAEACAGLRFLVASLVFGCFFSVVMYRSWLRRAAFIALSVTVPIGANGLRALGIIVLAHIEGSAAAVEADHVLYGWIFFSLVTLVLIAIGMTFVDRPQHQPPPLLAASRTPGSRGSFAVASVAAVVLALLGPAYAARLDSGFAAAAHPAIPTGQIAPPWRAIGDGGTGWRPLVLGADRVQLESFEKPGSGIVVRYVALYRLRTVGNALTRSDNRIADDVVWQLAQRGRAEIALDGRNVAVVSDRIESGPRARLVWSFYIVDGKIVARLFKAKLLQARALLLRRAPLAAFVAVSASEDDPDRPAPAQLEAFLRADAPLLRALLKASRGGAAGVAAGGAGQASRHD